MPLLDNPWIGYTDRSYIQMKAAIIAKKNVPVTGIPELDDDSEGNDFIKEIGIWCGIADGIQYYLDNRARETFLTSAKRFESGVKMSREWDYRIKGVAPASGSLRFSVLTAAPSDISIPLGTRVETVGGIAFYTTAAATILTATTFIDVEAKQWIPVAETSQGVSDGSVRQKFELVSDIVDGSVTVTINGADVYAPQDTFAISISTDEHFIAGINENKKVEVLFADDINGKIPPNTQDVAIGWATSQGADGNVAANQITEVPTVIPAPPGLVVTVNNLAGFTGGGAIEALADLKVNIPLSLHTLYRAVTDLDYEYVTRLMNGVAKAGESFNCGKTVDLYIVPDGGGIASATLIADTLTFMNGRKMNTTTVVVYSAGEVEFEIEWNVIAIANYLNSAVKNSVEVDLLAFFALDNQLISGTVNIGDLYETIEKSTGVNNSNLVSVKTVPYARPMVSGVPALVWTRSLKVGAVAARYEITMNTATQYKLLRDNVFLGNFNTGSPVSALDVDLNVTGSYTPGDKWEFFTYAMNLDTTLTEPSLPVAKIAGLTINVTGGL